MHMHSAIIAMATLLGVVSAGSDSEYQGVGFGSTWGLWPPAINDGGPIIMKVTTTLTVPEFPNPAQDLLFLWPGINTAGGAKGKGLVQVTVGASTDPGAWAGCESLQPGQWQARTSFFETSTNYQEIGACVGVKTGDRLAITYKYNKAQDTYDQKMLVNGKKKSSWTSQGFGPGVNFYIETECQKNWRGNSMTHVYSNTTITLDKTYGDYSKYLHKEGSTDSGLTSKDGKVWHADKITIEGAGCWPW